MPNYCVCKLTITGPNRQAVLTKLKGGKPHVEDGKEWPVYFDVEQIVSVPEGLGERYAEWAQQNWGCCVVYKDLQDYKALEDADVIFFSSPWNPPLLAIRTLSTMFPENSFLLEDGGMDLPSGTTLFRGGKHSQYHFIPNVNRSTGKTATLYEIFLAVLRRTGDVAQAQAEVERVKVERLSPGTLSPDTPESTTQDPSYDPALAAEVRERLAPRLYDVTMIPADEERIEDLMGIITQCVSKVQQDISGLEVKSLA